MKTLLFSSLIFYALLLLSACSTVEPVTVKAGPSDHAHRNPNTIPAGDYHVQGIVDRRSGEFVVRVLDRHEQPLWVSVPSIEAVVTHADGRVEKVRLQAVNYTDSALDENANVTPEYRRRFPWIAGLHDVDILVRIPLPDGKIYEVSFHSKADEAAPDHSGLS